MPAQRSERTPRSFWFDPRFAIGIGLVILSVVGVVGVVAAADHSERVYAARTALSPGDRVDADDLELASVRLGRSGGKYLEDLPAGGLVVTRAVSAGELVPTSAVGSVGGLRSASVVVPVTGDLARSIAAGTVVDVWAAAPSTTGQSFGPPAVLVSSATVVRVVEKQGIMTDRSGQSVEVQIARTKIARVLEAVANGDSISLVPVSSPVGAER